MIIKPDELLDSLKTEWVSCRETGRERKGVSFGWQTIDECMLLNKKFLMLITGYPSYGKSTFIDAMTINISVMHDWRWLFFSTETDNYTTHLRKLVQIHAGKSLIALTEKEIEKSVRWINDHFTWIGQPEDTFLSLDDVLRITKDLLKEGKYIDGLIIDPWNDLSHKDSAGREDQYVRDALMKIKAFSRNNDLLSCLVIHPKTQEKNNDGSFPIPHLRNCSGGAMWWNKADYGISIHRKDFNINGVHVYIQKVKNSLIGQQGATFLDCEPTSLRLKDTFVRDFLLPDAFTDLPEDEI